MIDLLWTGIGGLAGAEAGVVAGWLASRRAKLRRWTRRYITGLGVVLGAGVAAALTLPPVVEARLDEAGPAFKAIREHYPGWYAEMTAATKGVDPRDPDALQEKLRPLLISLIQAHRNEMDDESAAAMAQLMLDETGRLRDASPETCVAALSGRQVDVDLHGAGPVLRQRNADVTAALVEQVATRPQSPPGKLSAEESLRLTEHALDKLSSGERDVVLPLLQQGRQPDGSREAAAYCAFQRARLGAALDAPAGTLRRFLVG